MTAFTFTLINDCLIHISSELMAPANLATQPRSQRLSLIAKVTDGIR